ncbi:MAG: fibrobacter succinogenes major paralogous domain-containing protein [Acidobacteriota bacterium]
MKSLRFLWLIALLQLPAAPAQAPGIVEAAGRTSPGDIMIREAESVTDIEGNVYKTVRIGNQIWMVENLKTTKLNDGQSIPCVTDDVSWSNLETPGYCFYNNDSANKDLYGALYNWHAVNTGKLAPQGWHVPTDAEWTILTNTLGGEETAGGEIKEKGFAHWVLPNTGANNSTGFSALPGAGRAGDGDWGGLAYYANFWTSTESSATNAWRRHLVNDDRNVRRDNGSKGMGFSVRCVKD